MGDVTTIMKGCSAPGDITEDTCKEMSEGGGTGTGCLCEGNLCNSGFKNNFSAGLFIAVAVIKMVVY